MPGTQQGLPGAMQIPPAQGQHGFPSMAATTGPSAGMLAPPPAHAHTAYPAQTPTVINQQQAVSQQQTSAEQAVSSVSAETPATVSHMDTDPPASSGVNNSNKENEAELTAEEEEDNERMNPPKPRPPSPEYDDPEGREVHEENVHLFRVSF